MWDLVLILYIAYCIWVLTRDTPIEAKVWYYLAKDWQRLARFWGEMGMGAELLYHDAMRRYSLA